MIKKLVQKYGIYLGFFFIFILFSFASPYFLKGRNISNILVQSSILAIIAAGETIVILTGGIDLSVGSIVALTSLFSAFVIVDMGQSVVIGIMAALILSMSIGLINGVAISYGKVPAFITTLGMMSIARGGALALKSGQPISGIPAAYENLAIYEIFGFIPIFIIYFLAIYIIGYIFLVHTRHGRYIYAIGGNVDAARLSGVNVKIYKTLAYVICGFFAGIGGILLTARLDYATPIAGMGYELDVIAATVIGGTSLSGGDGHIFGTFLGAVLIGTLRNGLTLLNVSSYYQQIIIGVVIVGAVFLDRIKDIKRD
ncbi:MAG: ABC transporter permease [Candidatus Celaenobacter polaris]|nr:ABC transporter permease [Candidatus Celaenobacter polaris]